MTTEHSLFPVQMVARWQSPQCFTLHANLSNWLLDPSSLTARLKSHCQHFRVEVLGQKIENCCAAEANSS